MRPRLLIAALTAFSLAAAYGQQPVPAAPPVAPPLNDPNQPVLTPEQQREKKIRLYDPLDAGDPLDTRGDPERSAKPAQPPVAQPRPAAAKPLPGSVAASGLKPVNPREEGPQVLTDEEAAAAPVQEYTGPAVLSRSYTVTRPAAAQQVKWSPFVGLSALYDSGLAAGNIASDGALLTSGSAGEALNWGLTGRHFWKHDQLGVDYRGNYNRYDSAGSYNGSNQSLNLDYSHAFTRHLSLNLVESASVYSQSFTLQNPALGNDSSVANISLASSPTVQVLDNGLKQSSTSLNLTWQKSARLSFTYGGSYFVVERNGNNLFGNSGYQAQTDVNYRYTRKLTVGVYYSFSEYTFTHHVQTNNSNTVGGIVSYALNRSTQLRLRAGGTRTESEGLTTVAIAPPIAALLGQSFGIVESYHLAWISDISAEVAKDFRRNRTARVSYARGIAPGNGALLTSTRESLSAGFSALLLRRYLSSVGVGRDSLSSVGQNVGKYSSDYVYIGFSRQFRQGLAANLRFDYRKFDVTSSPLLHSQYRVTLGFTWSPGEGPLKFW